MLKDQPHAAAIRIVPNPSDQALAELIGQASYFICLSRHEGFGIAPIEAMSAGLTPILSDIPPFRNLVEQSGMGLLMGVSSVASVEENIDRLLQLHAETQSDYSQRSLQAQQFVDRYNWRHIANRYMDVYQALASSR